MFLINPRIAVNSPWIKMAGLIELVVIYTMLLSTVQVFPAEAGAGECRRRIGARTIDCYDCDSRYDDYCDHIDRNNPLAPKPRSRPCHGCCVKFLHKLPQGEYIQRTCTEFIEINYFMVDHVCMSEGKGRGKMCFCEEQYCNHAPSNLKKYYMSNNYLMWSLLTLSILCTLLHTRSGSLSSFVRFSNYDIIASSR